MNSKNEFRYNYSAKEKEEIAKIRKKYSPEKQELSKLEQLRKLDQSVTRPGTIAALVIGIIGTLIFGTGMSCIMVWGENLFGLGIAVSIAGIILAAAAYPAYLLRTKKQKEKIALEILKLTDEISDM